MSTAGARRSNPAHARRSARRLAVQALYQWQLSDQSVGAIDEQFMEEQDVQRADIQYFRELLHKVPARLDELDAELGRWLDRPIGEVDPVERAILRIALYELKFRIDIPYRIVLSEAVGLAKTFGAAESHKYVNGVLDKAARTLRPVEIEGGRR